MLLYMIRHGQSKDNEGQRHSGWSNCSLSEKGIADAQATQKRLIGVEFDKVYSSDTLRAVQTRKIIRPDCEPVLTELLREINVGELSGRPLGNAPENDIEKYENARNTRDFRAYGGESTEDQLKRVQKFIEKIENDPSDRIAVFCHEGTIRCAFTLLINDGKWAKIACKNGAICIFECSDGKWTLNAWDK